VRVTPACRSTSSNELLDLDLPRGLGHRGGLVFDHLGTCRGGGGARAAGPRLRAERVQAGASVGSASPSAVRRRRGAGGAGERRLRGRMLREQEAIRARRATATDADARRARHFRRRPNVGTSTLHNRILGRRSEHRPRDKPQTTRNQVRGVLNRPDAQVVFVDTPGIHKPADDPRQPAQTTPPPRRLAGVDVVAPRRRRHDAAREGRPLRRRPGAGRRRGHRQQDRHRTAGRGACRQLRGPPRSTSASTSRCRP
jgi:hypothetical protein